MLENNDDDETIIFIDEEPKPDIEKVNSIIKQVLELARSYKINNYEDIQKSIINIINNSKMEKLLLI